MKPGEHLLQISPQDSKLQRTNSKDHPVCPAQSVSLDFIDADLLHIPGEPPRPKPARILGLITYRDILGQVLTPSTASGFGQVATKYLDPGTNYRATGSMATLGSVQETLQEP